MTVDTLCVQGGWSPKKGESRQVPIISSTTFRYETSEQMADLFDLKAPGGAVSPLAVYRYAEGALPDGDALLAPCDKVGFQDGRCRVSLPSQTVLLLTENN